MHTLADRWRAYCGRHCLSLDALAYGLSLIESAADQMRERAAKVVIGEAPAFTTTSAMADVHARIRSLTSD